MASTLKENDTLYPCHYCSRHFIRSSLEKHEPICKKMSKSRRKIFDSGKQRATGSDITITGVRNAQKEREMVGGTFPRPKTSWREKHESFVSAVSASKQVDYALKTGTSLSLPPKTSLTRVLTNEDLEDLVRKYCENENRSPKNISPPYHNDYIRCDYCGRNFNAQAAERHIPFCKNQHERKGPIKVIQANRMQTTASKRQNTSTRSNSQRILAQDTSEIWNSATYQNRCQNRSRIPSRRSSADRTFIVSKEPSQQLVNDDSSSAPNRSKTLAPVKRSSSAPRQKMNSSSRSSNISQLMKNDSYSTNGSRILYTRITKTSQSKHSTVKKL